MSQQVCLLVENNPYQLRSLANLISENNLIVYMAQNPEQGLDVLGNQIVDLILCDIEMNDGEDMPAICTLKNAASHLPLIATTKPQEKPVPTRISLAKARSYGADFIMEAPFDGEKFRHILNLAQKYTSNSGRLSHAMMVGRTTPIAAHCQKLLEAAGWRITIAKDFTEALNVTCPLDLDIIITQYCGQNNCRDLIPALKENFPGVGIVSICESETIGPNAALHLGATTAHFGDFTSEELLGAIKNAQIIAHSNLLREAFLEVSLGQSQEQNQSAA